MEAVVMATTGPDRRDIRAIALATPGYGVPAEDEVYYRDINVFLLPASDVVARIRALGLEVLDIERGFTYVVPEYFLTLWRNGGPEELEDGRERPVYFESVTIEVTE